MEFSHECALAVFQSTAPFPVNFDQAWPWLGYSTKQKAKNKLLNFELGVDYTLTQMVKRVQGNRGGGSVQFESIFLTVDCLKSLGMMAGTEKGRQIRRYFLDCERIAKITVEVIPAQAEEIERLRLQLALAQIQERLMAASQILGSINPDLPVLILRPDVTVIERPVPVETTVTVDERNRLIAKYDLVGISYLAQRYGFGRGNRANNACRQWLLSVGVADIQWVEEPTAHTTRKLPRQMVSHLDKQFAAKFGNRQRLLGE